MVGGMGLGEFHFFFWWRFPLTFSYSRLTGVERSGIRQSWGFVCVLLTDGIASLSCRTAVSPGSCRAVCLASGRSSWRLTTRCSGARR